MYVFPVFPLLFFVMQPTSQAALRSQPELGDLGLFSGSLLGPAGCEDFLIPDLPSFASEPPRQEMSFRIPSPRPQQSLLSSYDRMGPVSCMAERCQMPRIEDEFNFSGHHSSHLLPGGAIPEAELLGGSPSTELHLLVDQQMDISIPPPALQCRPHPQYPFSQSVPILQYPCSQSLPASRPIPVREESLEALRSRFRRLAGHLTASNDRAWLQRKIECLEGDSGSDSDPDYSMDQHPSDSGTSSEFSFPASYEASQLDSFDFDLEAEGPEEVGPMVGPEWGFKEESPAPFAGGMMAHSAPHRGAADYAAAAGFRGFPAATSGGFSRGVSPFSKPPTPATTSKRSPKPNRRYIGGENIEEFPPARPAPSRFAPAVAGTSPSQRFKMDRAASAPSLKLYKSVAPGPGAAGRCRPGVGKKGRPERGGGYGGGSRQLQRSASAAQLRSSIVSPSGRGRRPHARRPPMSDGESDDEEARNRRRKHHNPW